MKIKYHPKQLSYLKYGAFFYSLLGIFALLVLGGNIFSFGLVPLGVLHIIIYYFQKSKGFATITENAIIRHDFPSKKLLIKNITEIKNLAGNIIFKTKEKKLIFTKEYLDKNTLEKIQLLSEQLKNPLTH